MTVTLTHYDGVWYRKTEFGWEFFSYGTKGTVRQEVKERFGADIEIEFYIRKHYGNRSPSGKGSRPYKENKRREKYGRSAKDIY